jgi:hypothetical protein
MVSQDDQNLVLGTIFRMPVMEIHREECRYWSSPLQLRRKRHSAGPAAGAAQGDEDALLLLVVEVGAVEHGAGLALKEFVERQVAGDNAVVGGEGVGVLGRRGGRFSQRLFSFRWFRHYAVRK